MLPFPGLLGRPPAGHDQRAADDPRHPRLGRAHAGPRPVAVQQARRLCRPQAAVHRAPHPAIALAEATDGESESNRVTSLK